MSNRSGHYHIKRVAETRRCPTCAARLRQARRRYYYTKKISETIKRKYPQVTIYPPQYQTPTGEIWLRMDVPEDIWEEVDDFAIRFTTDLAVEKKVSILPMTRIVPTDQKGRKKAKARA